MRSPAEIHERLDRIRAQVGPGVTVVAATKYVALPDMAALAEAGVDVVGENRAQDLEAKHAEYGDAFRWHFIGHLQSNKAKYAIRLFDMVHSVDSIPLAEELNRRAEQAGQVIKVMIEVNLSKEATKFGTDEEQLLKLARGIQNLKHLALEGLMTMPPYFDSPEMSRPYYVALRELKEKMASEGIPLQGLSMGMSNDFEIAIEEGATYVRVGTAIFGPRKLSSK